MSTADPQLLHPLILPSHFVLLLLSLAVPSTFLRRFFFIPGIIYTAWLLETWPISTNPGAAYAGGSVWVFSLSVLAHLLFTSPETTLFRPGIERPGDALSYPPLKKLRWAADLLSTPRGVGWNHCVPYIPPRAIDDDSRGRFLVWALKRFVTMYMTVDVMHEYAYAQQGFRYTAEKGAVGMLLDGLAFGFQSWMTLEMHYLFASMLAVGSGWSRPQDWPPVFGSLKEAYTLSRFWNRFWHQELRNAFISYSSFVVEVLRINPDSRAASVLKTYVSFLICATFHLLASIPAAHAISSSHVAWGVFNWHMVQAVGITFEKVIMKLYQKVRGSDYSEAERMAYRAIGYAWMLLFQTRTIQWYGHDFMMLGLDHRADTLPWSPVRALGWKRPEEPEF